MAKHSEIISSVPANYYYYDYVGGETLGKGFSEDGLRNALKGVTVVIYLYGGFLGLGAVE